MASVTVNSTSTVKPSQTGSPFVRDIFAQFIHALGYCPEAPITDDNVSYQALQKEFAAYNTGAWFDALCRESATMAEVTAINL